MPPTEASRAGHLAGRRDGDATAARDAWAQALDRRTAARALTWLP